MTGPARITSEMGRLVLDLRSRGMTDGAIARHVGCHREQIRQLVEDPQRSPRYSTGQALIRLHDDVMCGTSMWGRRIRALRSHGWTYEQIAVRVGASVQTLYERCGDPTWVPSHDLGEKILKLYMTHVGSHMEEL